VDEYQQLERLVRRGLGNRAQFKRGVNFYQLKGCRPDLYLFDVGGMCYEGFGAAWNWCRNLADVVIDDHPSTLFVPWSSMTVRDWRDIVTEEVPALQQLPNVWLPPKDGQHEFLSPESWEEPFLQKLIEWCR
jgi:hypothetical protein